MKTGILGGTFDPVHLGHIRIAEETKQRIGLDNILFIPAGQPWFKVSREITPATHRVKMLELATIHESCFSISRIEVERNSPSYTVDTMITLNEEKNAGDELFFIMGWDSLFDIAKWKEPDKLIKLCSLVALTRAYVCRPDLKVLERNIPGITDKTLLLDMAPVDISSSDIRRRVSVGLSIKGLVPDEVADYIKAYNLYMNG